MAFETVDATRRAGRGLGWALRCGACTVPLVALLAGLAPEASAAPAPAPPAKAKKPTPVEPTDDDDTELSQIVVTATQRPQIGAVAGDIKPELQLSPADIQSYGVSTVTELLDELGPEIRSDQGRGGGSPVVLLNGRRISGFNEIRDIPTEAILRVDILPEEVALKYGYSADQRVVNIVLRRRFRALTNEVTGGAPTAGGQENGQVEADSFRVRGDNRFNFDLKYQANSSLTENERDLVSSSTSQPYAIDGNVVSATPGGQIDPALSALVGRPVSLAGVPAAAATRAPTLSDFAGTAGTANVSDVGRYRTLSPATQTVSANAVLSRVLPNRFSATVNATLGATTSDALQGLPRLNLTVPAGDPFSPFGQNVRLYRYVDGLGALRQNVDGWTGHLGGTLNRDAGRWRLSLTGAYDHADSLTRGDAGVDTTSLQALLAGGSTSFNPFAPLSAGLLAELPQNKARSRSDAANFQFLASGPLLKLPAGQLSATFKLGDAQSWYSTRSVRLGFARAADLARNDLTAQASLDVPLASRRANVLPALGEFSINLNAALDRASDFGDLTTFGYGLRWTPVTGVRLIVSHTRDEAAPSVQQLGDPVVLTQGSRIFDFETGQTVDVTRLTGGDPTLIGDRRDVFKVGLNLKPFADRDLNITASYVDSRTRNPISTFPAATAEIEAAFPGRFTRDASGQLVQVDYRPVNFARQERKELRWGFNYSRAVGRPPAPRVRRPPGEDGGPPRPRRDGAADGPASAQGQGAAQPPPGAGGAAPARDGGGRDGGRARGVPGGGAGGGPGGGGFRAGGGGAPAQPAGRLQFAVYHTVYFEDRLLVRSGGPLLDMLNGSAAGNGGGQPRHEIEAQAGYTLNGLGARLSADWKSGTTVRGGGSTGDLSFSGLATVNLRLFANFGQMRSVVQRRPWLRGSRLTLSVNNLFNQRQAVTAENGVTPLSYQPAYLDPAGRTLRLSFRKLFL